MKIIGKSYVRAFIVSVAAACAIWCVVIFGKARGVMELSQHRSDEIYKIIGGTWLFPVVLLLVFFFLTSSKVFSRRLLDDDET